MYNEEQKKKFIREYTKSLSTAKVATTIFDAVELYEHRYGKDVCQMSTEEVQGVINEVLGVRIKSHAMSMTILREYAKWCITMRIDGACDAILKVQSVGLEKMRRYMVSGPLHLQMCLDSIFDKEIEETIDIIYRSYFWMAYGGIKEEDIPKIKKENIDLHNMSVSYGGIVAPIYREAIPSITAALNLVSFNYKHPNYSKIIRRDRASGTSIIRGIKAESDVMTLRAAISRKVAKAVKSGTAGVQLSYHRVALSGLFYRTYESERAGIPADFSEAAIEFTIGRNYKSDDERSIVYIQNRVAKEYMEDYLRWKLLFSM